MASKRKGSVAPYVALVVAVIIFVPVVRDAFLDLVAPLLDLFEEHNPFRG